MNSFNKQEFLKFHNITEEQMKAKKSKIQIQLIYEYLQQFYDAIPSHVTESSYTGLSLVQMACLL